MACGVEVGRGSGLHRYRFASVDRRGRRPGRDRGGWLGPGHGRTVSLDQMRYGSDNEFNRTLCMVVYFYIITSFGSNCGFVNQYQERL